MVIPCTRTISDDGLARLSRIALTQAKVFGQTGWPLKPHLPFDSKITALNQVIVFVVGGLRTKPRMKVPVYPEKSALVPFVASCRALINTFVSAVCTSKAAHNPRLWLENNMIVDHYPPQQKGRSDAKSDRRSTSSTNKTPTTRQTLVSHAESIQSSGPTSPSSPAMMQFEIELRRTISRADEVSSLGSPNHRYQRQSKRLYNSSPSKSPPSPPKLPIGRISEFFRGRDTKSDTIPRDLLERAVSCAVSEITSGDFGTSPTPKSQARTKNVPKRALPPPCRGKAVASTNRCQTYPAASRTQLESVSRRPSNQDSKKHFYPDVFVPPPPLQHVSSAVYAEFKSDSEVMVSSTTFDLRSKSPRACNQSIRISVSPKRSPQKPPAAPCLDDSPSAASVSAIMRSLGASMIQDSLDCASLVDDDALSDDESTVHLLEMAHSEHVYTIDTGTEADWAKPPKLKVVTSTSSAKALIKTSSGKALTKTSSAKAGIEEVAMSTPILSSQTTSTSCSSRTIEWKSYQTYYDSADAVMRSPAEGIHRAVSELTNQSSDSNKKQPAIPRVNHGLNFYSAPQTLEVAPGHFVNLRGATETLLYVAADATSPRQMIITETCIACRTCIHSVCDCEYILCPVCHTILSSGVEGHGVGLGFLTSDWDEWNFNLLTVETAAECSPFAQMPSMS
jgi:hypothetical protein